MKLLSVAIPCYNSAAYMANCIESLLAGGDEVEILIVNDGSTKDNTAEIADQYALKYPHMIKAIHQENKGHGGAVNTGLANATGYFFKVVDSDDHVNKKAYLRLLEVLRAHVNDPAPLDLVLTNFVYDKQGAAHKKVMRYTKLFPENKVFGWDSFPKFRIDQYILMHSIIYRTGLLRECGLSLPEHTFYVDNIFAFQPLPWVKNMLYLDVDLYRYFIGREDQSVNEKVMISRMDQQLRVNKIMVNQYTDSPKSAPSMGAYMLNYLNIITMVTSVLCIRSGTPEHLKAKDEIWDYIKQINPQAYRKMRRSLPGIATHLPGAAGRKIVSCGYVIAQKLFGFN